MAHLREQIVHIWNLRQDPRRHVRVLWWVSLIALIGLFLRPREVWPFLAGIWITVCVFRGMFALIWGIVNLRTIALGHRVGLRWAFWLALFASLFYFAGSQEQRVVAHPWPTSVLLLLSVALFPGLYALFLLFSLYGAAQGTYAFREKPDQKEASLISVTAFWLSTLGAVALILLLGLVRQSPLTQTAVFCGINYYTQWLTAWMRRRGYEPQEVAPRLVNALLGRLNFRWTFRGKSYRLDLRGVTLGLFASAFALVIGNQLLLATEEAALASLMRIRHQVYEAITKEEKLPLPPAGNVVLLKMDASSRADILTWRSESAVQADIIRKLHKLGVARIVLPYPTLSLKKEDIGATTEEAVSKTRRDLGPLADTMREANNVVLVLDQENHTGPEARELTQSAHDVTTFGLEIYGPAELPSIPLSWQQAPPTPILLLSLQNGQRLLPESQGDTFFVRTVAGIPLPQGLPGRMIMDFRSDVYKSRWLFNEACETVDYATVLSDKPVTVQRPLRGTSEAVPQATFFRDKTVFLEPLIQSSVETPIGTMPRYDALARITNTLLSGYALQRSNVVWTFLLTLSLGALVGHICARRDPLEASWRIVLLLLAIFTYTLVAYFAGIWVDAVVPIVAVSVAYVLLTRLTFTLERDARERNRRLLQRFLAPRIAEQLLDAPEETLGLGGDKRRVVVLFADVRNFTGFAETHAPEEVIEVVNHYMTALTDALDLYGGILDKYTGDGLMAFFLIDREPEAEVERSVLAALAMRDAAQTLSVRQRAEGRPVLNLGFGMHYGEAVVGLVGNRNRQINYTALGHTVVVSARLQTLAEGGEIVISETMYEMIRDKFHFVAQSPVQVKGISTPMRPYFVLDPVEQQ